MMPEYKYQLRTVSPVFIGNGEKWSPMEWLAGTGSVYFFDWPQIDKWLATENITYDDFVGFVETTLKKIEQEQDYKEKRKIEGTLSLSSMLNQFGLNTTKLQDLCMSKIPNATQNERPYSNSEISRFIHTGGDSYIPGSEIKGAIRTAVLYNLMCSNQNKAGAALAAELETFYQNNKGAIDQLAAEKNNRRIEKSKAIKNISIQSPNPGDAKRRLNSLSDNLNTIFDKWQVKLLSPGGYDAHNDILRQLLLGDTLKLSDDSQLIAKITSINTQKNISLFAEVTGPDIVTPITGIEAWKENKAIQSLGSKERYLGGLDKIFEMCRTFSDHLLEDEIATWRNLKPDVVGGLEKIRQINVNASPVIRLGGAEGQLSTTICLWFKRNGYNNLLENVVGPLSKGKSYQPPLTYPKSRRCTYIDGQPHTLGWVRIEPYNPKDHKATQTAAATTKTTMELAIEKIQTGAAQRPPVKNRPPKAGDKIIAKVITVGKDVVLETTGQDGTAYLTKADRPYNPPEAGEAVKCKVQTVGGDGKVKKVIIIS
jgi:CRISPR-associated protein Csm5